MEFQIPPWEGAILVDRGIHCEVWALSAVNCAKTAEPIDLPFVYGLGWAKGSTSSIVFALMGGHIAATWRIRLNHPSTTAMRLMSNYFDHLLSLDTIT